MSEDVLHIRGVVLPEGEQRDLYVADGILTYDGTRDAATVAAGWILPGLTDLHCHVGLAAHGAVDEPTQEQQACTDRDAGTLLLRDAGSPADTRWIDDRADLPRIVRAGRHIARTRRYLRNFGEEIEPAQLPAEAARQARRGDGWVKIVGDWIDRDVGDLAPCWPVEAARAAIEAAHDEGARVTTHVFGEDAVRDLVAAGIDCVEHGTGLDDDTIAAMAAGGVGLVPTLINIANFPSIAASAEAKFPRYAAHMRRLHENSRATVRRAYDAGVPVFAGTDAGGSLPHGLIAAEVLALHEAGLPAADALAAGSWRGREFLGHPALEEGAPADLVVYPADPRADLAVLHHPARIVLRGRVVR